MKRTVKSAVFRYVIGLGMLLQQGIMLPAHADIFKCTNKLGKIYYNDKPCPVETEEKKIQNEKDPVNGYVPPAFVVNKSVVTKPANKPATHTGISMGTLKEKEIIDAKSINNRVNKVKMLSGGDSLKRKEESNKYATKELINVDKIPPNGNYSKRKRTIKDKKAYLGIRNVVE